MPAIVLYISGHGFGHASRQVEVMNALHAKSVLSRGMPLLIRSSVSPDLLERTLRAPYRLLPGATDSGIRQRSSIEHDHDATARDTLAFYDDFARRVDDEVARLHGLDVALIVGDIPPLAFAAADRLGVPSVAIANFTWDWIYATEPGLLDAAPALLPRLAAAYSTATLALQLPFSGGFEVFPRRQPLPLIARRPTKSRPATRAYFGVPEDRPAALLSFGGYGLPNLDLSTVDCLGDWTLITTDRVSAPTAGRSIVRITERDFHGSDYRYEDLVAAADAVVTKPGYGIIAECIAAGTPMLYTSRGMFREYDVLVAALPKFVRSRFISHADLFAGRWRAALTALVAQVPPPETMATNGADVAADVLATYVSR